jgi:hypothetical protein
MSSFNKNEDEIIYKQIPAMRTCGSKIITSDLCLSLLAVLVL